MKVYEAIFPVLKPKLQWKRILIEAQNKSDAVKIIRNQEPHLTHYSNINITMIIPHSKYDDYFRTIDEFGQTVYYRKDELK